MIRHRDNLFISENGIQLVLYHGFFERKCLKTTLIKSLSSMLKNTKVEPKTK